MTYTSNRSIFAFGRQTSGKGTALASPKFEMPLETGLAGPSRSITQLPWAADSRDVIGYYVDKVSGRFRFVLPATPKATAALFYYALGALATSGTGPYTHAATGADTLPWLTMFYKQPGSQYWTVPDCKIESLTATWGAGADSPVRIEIEGPSAAAPTAVTNSTSKWSAATVTEGADGSATEPFFTYFNADLKADHSSTPAATALTNVQSGSLRIANNLEEIQTTKVSNSDLGEQGRMVEINLNDVVLADNVWINRLFAGADTAAAGLSSQPLYGSFALTLRGSDEAAAATRSLALASTKVAWHLDDIPEGSGDGSTVKYGLQGFPSKPASGSIVTATTINSDSGANY